MARFSAPMAKKDVSKSKTKKQLEQEREKAKFVERERDAWVDWPLDELVDSDATSIRCADAGDPRCVRGERRETDRGVVVLAVSANSFESMAWTTMRRAPIKDGTGN